MFASVDDWVNLDALWKICVIGLICGAGLPAIFAVGLRFLSLPPNHETVAVDDDPRIYFGNTIGAVIAGICFAIVLAAIGWGIYWIVSA